MSFYFVYAGDDCTGYGYAGRKIAEALVLLGTGCVARDVTGVDEKSTTMHVSEPVVFFHLPESWPAVESGRRFVGFTMFEGRGLPAERVALVNELADVCLVPSAWCAEAFEECGVTVPVLVAPLGVDASDFPLLDRSGRDGGVYRFYWNGEFAPRKGWDLVYLSFWGAFRGDAGVELILHFRDGVPAGHSFSDANVRAIGGYKPRSVLLGLMHEADCFVYPARGEGWGLPPREAASTGLPVIATDYSGLAEDIESWALPLRVERETEVRFMGFMDDPMLYAEPDLDHLTELMLWCYNNRKDASNFGREAGRWLAGHGSWEVTAREIVRAIES